MERAEAASSSGAEELKVVNDEEKPGHGVAAIQGKLKVVRVKRKREQEPIENICKLNSVHRLFFSL